MSQKIKRIFFKALGIVLGLGCLVLVFLYFGSGQANSILKETDKTVELRYYDGADKYGQLVIPVAGGISMEDIKIENRYLSGKFLIRIQRMDGSFIRDEGIAGSLENVTDVRLTEQEELVCLEVSTDGVFVCESELVNNKLCLWFRKPKEVYEKCIVIDVAHGGASLGTVVEGISEKDVLLEVADKLKELLDDTDIQVYYTRLDDTQVKLADRIALAQAVDADMLISLQLSEESEDELKCGVRSYYNGIRYNNGLNSGELAYFMEENVVRCSKALSLGIASGEESDYLIHNATVPTVVVELGYLTNAEERSLLVRKDYQEMLAQGICEGILAAYEDDVF